MSDNPRIEELQRRVQKDPASIAFAQLAEEYRRAGHFEDAIRACRAGLDHHPGYLSARVTLGRSLIELNDLDAAETELRYVLRTAAENLAAIRGIAEIYHRRGDLAEALKYYRSALSLARHDPDLEQTVEDITRTLEPAKRPADVPGGMSFAQASAEFLSASEPAAPVVVPPVIEPVRRSSDFDRALEDITRALEPPARQAEVSGGISFERASVEIPQVSSVAAPHPDLGALPELERFLDAIVAYARRTATA